MTEGSDLCYCPPSHQAPTGMHRRKDLRRGVEGGEVADGGESMPAVMWENHGTEGNYPSVNSLEKRGFSFFLLVLNP